MTSFINNVLVIVRLFFAAFVMALFIGSTITYFITEIKFALFLTGASLVPASLFLAYYFDKYLLEQ